MVPPHRGHLHGRWMERASSRTARKLKMGWKAERVKQDLGARWEAM